MDEMEKKQDLTVWKLAKIETMNEVTKSESAEDVKLRTNLKDKSSIGSDKTAMSAPTTTPKRYYNRTSSTTMNQPHKKPMNLFELSDEHDDKFSKERVRRKSTQAENTILHPTTSNKSSIVQSGGRHDQLKHVSNNNIPHNTSFSIGLPPTVHILGILYVFIHFNVHFYGNTL